MNLLARIIAAALLAACHPAFAFIITPRETGILEYVNEITGHFVLLDSGEGASVEHGSAGPGWERTGYTVNVPNPAGLFEPPSSFIPVCRFYSPSNNSHFITANAAECESLKDPASGWVFEKIAFYVDSLGPQCPTGQSPVYRVYNNRHAFRDANHRFTPDATTRDQMIAAGWIDEGVAFCARSWSVSPQKSFEVRAKAIEPAEQCESRVGPCVALRQLAPMPNFIYSFLPPFFVTRNPDYPFGAEALTGTFVDLFTGQPVADLAGIRSHSFVGMYGIGGPPYGVHVVGTDRLSGPYASIGPMYELPGAAPAPGGIDERVFPWKGARHHTLVANFTLQVPTLERADASSHAYGGLLLQFGDATSGRSFYATVQAYGSVPPGDFVAPDAVTGLPIVSTVFRADPAFGSRLAGDFAACDGATSCLPAATKYQFRIGDADFAKILERARTVDASLSPDIANYFVAQVRVHNETYGTAEIGATVQSLALDVWY